MGQSQNTAGVFIKQVGIEAFGAQKRDPLLEARAGLAHPGQFGLQTRALVGESEPSHQTMAPLHRMIGEIDHNDETGDRDQRMTQAKRLPGSTQSVTLHI